MVPLNINTEVLQTIYAHEIKYLVEFFNYNVPIDISLKAKLWFVVKNCFRFRGRIGENEHGDSGSKSCSSNESMTDQ